MGRSAAIPARYRRYAKGLATPHAMSRPKCSIVGHHSEIALPDDPPEFKPTGLTRADHRQLLPRLAVDQTKGLQTRFDCLANLKDTRTAFRPERLPGCGKD